MAWHAYYNLAPFGEERADLRIAQLTAFVGNMFKSKKTKAYKPIDFMPYAAAGKRSERKPLRSRSKWEGFKAMVRNMGLPK